MNAQDKTLDQYQQFMKINAAAHLFRSARELGVLAELREGQRTLSQLCEKLTLKPGATKLVLDALVASSIIEQYEDDYALSRVAHLLCQYAEDLGDATWNRLVGHVQQSDESGPSTQPSTGSAGSTRTCEPASTWRGGTTI